jgi:membrane associated rhomboid family serine protease
MFPLSDDNPRNSTPVVTLALIVACALVFLWEVSLSSKAEELATYSLGLVPARLFHEARLPAGAFDLPAWLTIFTSMFIHGGWLHLGGNMLYLWIFGDNVEDAMGHGRFLVFYLLCGTAAALTQTWIDPHSTVPMVGASGAIAGVLGAYILLFPRATVRTLVFLGFFVTIVHVPALIVLGIWFVLQLSSAAMAAPDQPGVAFWAHVGGFTCGLVLTPFLRRREIGLFNPPRNSAFRREGVRGPWG